MQYALDRWLCRTPIAGGDEQARSDELSNALTGSQFEVFIQVISLHGGDDVWLIPRELDHDGDKAFERAFTALARKMELRTN